MTDDQKREAFERYICSKPNNGRDDWGLWLAALRVREEERDDELWDLRDSFDCACHSIESLQDTVTRLERENAEMRTKFHAAQDNWNEADDNAEDAEVQCEVLQRENAGLRERIETWRDRADNASRSGLQQQEDLATLRAERDRVVEANHVLREESAAHKRSIQLAVESGLLNAKKRICNMMVEHITNCGHLCCEDVIAEDVRKWVKDEYDDKARALASLGEGEG